MSHRFVKIISFFLLSTALLVACSASGSVNQAQSTPTTNSAQLANPAAENCTKVGGTETIQTKPDGSQFGVCVFQNNQQCEEWALFRGNCPVGGVAITGYVTTAATFCAISGGQYTVTGNSAQSDEIGSCVLPGSVTCDAAAYYDGKCP